MHITISMAGLAEAAFCYGLLIIAAILLLVGGLLAFAWWKGSAIAATIACILVLLVGLLLQPWSAFAPPTTADPDEAYWLVRFRVASVVWAFFFVAGVACLTTVIRRRRLQTHDINAA
jgi:heme/copper-type cytochrome/quinol oxidase subunit 2